MTTPPWTCVCGAYGLTDEWCRYCGRWAWWLAPPQAVAPPTPPRNGLDLRGKALAVASLLIVVAGFVRIGNVQAAEEAAARAALAATVAELSDFVAAHHGGPFLHPVPATLLGDDAFVDTLFSGDDTQTDVEETPDDFGATMIGLRMAGEQDDPAAESEEALGNGVVGFYDTHRERMYVRGRHITPYTRLVIVHELTHAWQDQHYDLDALDDTVKTSDEQHAVDALVEGDATRIENEWRAEQDRTVAAMIETVEASFGGAPDSAPSRAARSLAALYSFPYVVGERFVRALDERGGDDAIGRAFSDPPRTTQQVLHPAKYFGHERPAKITAPKGDGETVDSGVLGELGLTLLVARGVLDKDAMRVAAGWHADAYVTWESDTELCTEANIVMAGRAAARELEATLLRHRTGKDEAVERSGAAVRLRYCVAEESG